MTRVSIPAEERLFLFSSASRLTLGPTQPLGTLSLGVKRQGREADHTTPSSAEINIYGVIPPLPHLSSWHST
jgi:hypothetical protein